MTHFRPHYPPPAPRKPGPWQLFFHKRRSWLDGLYDRSYRMKMGEIHLPGVDLYMVNEPPLVRQVMVEQAANFPKHEMLGDALRPLLGDSIFTTNGAVWQRQRELMNPSFEAARVKRVFGRMRDAADAMVQRLRQVPAGSEHDLEVEMTHVAADIILRTILSQPLDGDSAHRVFEAFERYQALAPKLMMPAFFGLRWLRPWWLQRQSERAAAEIRSLLVGMIQPRHEDYQRALKAGDDAAALPDDDILATLLRVRDAKTGEGFGFDELVNQVAMLFLAGHETSASALSWSLHLLAHAPDVQQRMHDEAVAGLVGVEALDHDEAASRVKDMVLVRNVFRETLRLFPPVGFFARQAAVGCTMRDKQVRPGASVVISPWLIQRHRELWAAPDDFDPDRYEREASDAEAAAGCPHARESLRRAYLPFGMGPRVCIGTAFALQEASLILAMLAREFRFEPVPGHVPQPVGRLTIRADNGIRLKVHRWQAG
ncbi:MAG TPA: cytochrome P450 [Ideonella sp.]|uniref:cytochrome P450 n=1 Tax=Ideonella sp. TaxID=1929293 RepID=UPI002C506BC4|nr:cytochrome P450 [Ideonella sp.]HSI49978.1 cytochrome P450 [Ideonella sp.]